MSSSYVVASKHSRNHFIFEKYKTVQSMKLRKFPSKQSPCEIIHFFKLLSNCWKHSWKPFCKSLFSSYVAFLNVSSVKKKNWFQSREQVKISRSQVRNGGCCSVVTLFFVKKTLTKTDRCAAALSSRKNQLLVLHYSRPFLLPAFLRRRKM